MWHPMPISFLIQTFLSSMVFELNILNITEDSRFNCIYSDTMFKNNDIVKETTHIRVISHC